MIAAVVARLPEETICTLLCRLLGASGDDKPPAVVRRGIGIGTTRSACPARLEESEGLAWMGPSRPRGLEALRPPFHIHGDFAFVAAVDGEVLLGRGHFGGRPLYYATDPKTNAVLICSELAPLLRLVDQAVDHERLAGHVVWRQPADPSRTYWSAIKRVPSGHILRIGPRGLGRSDEIPFLPLPHRQMPIRDAAVELRDRVLAAVSRAMGPSEAVGVLVSGGLDSSGIFAAAVRASRTGTPSVGGFALDFGGVGDDRPHLAALSSMLSVSVHRVSPRACPAVRDVLVVNHAPVTYQPITCVMAMAVRSLGWERVLTGTGGDEVFGGDLRLFADIARRGHLVCALRGAAALSGYGTSTPRSRMSSLVVRPLLRSAIPKEVLRRIRARRGRPSGPGWAGPHLRRMVQSEGFAPIVADEDERSSDKSWMSHAAFWPLYLDHSDARAQTEKVGGFLEVDPFFDPEVVDFVASLSPEILFHGNRLRGLYQEALRGLVPETLRLRTDKAWMSAYDDIVEASGGIESLEDLAYPHRLADLGIVEPDVFRARFEELRNPVKDRFLWTEIWPVLGAEAFLRDPAAGS
ncbi:MAG TPA: asparagine synthase-related protein [Polyangiaceae bacterium]